MTITFYYNASDNNYVDKAITESFTAPLQGILREESSILSPTITVEAPASSFINVNYAYIADFNRYYYVTDIVSERNGLTSITMRVDVLMSYKEQIRNSTGLIRRNAYAYNLHINDGSLATLANGYTLAYQFSGGFNTQQYVLIVAGGG